MTVWQTSCLTGLGQTGGQPYSDTSPSKVSEGSLGEYHCVAGLVWTQLLCSNYQNIYLLG